MHTLKRISNIKFVTTDYFLGVFMGLVVQWIMGLTTDQKILGSNPGKLVTYFYSSYSYDQIKTFCHFKLVVKNDNFYTCSIPSQHFNN